MGKSILPCCMNSSMKAADCALELAKPADTACCPATLYRVVVTSSSQHNANCHHAEELHIANDPCTKVVLGKQSGSQHPRTARRRRAAAASSCSHVTAEASAADAGAAAVG